MHTSRTKKKMLPVSSFVTCAGGLALSSTINDNNASLFLLMAFIVESVSSIYIALSFHFVVIGLQVIIQLWNYKEYTKLK